MGAEPPPPTPAEPPPPVPEDAARDSTGAVDHDAVDHDAAFGELASTTAVDEARIAHEVGGAQVLLARDPARDAPAHDSARDDRAPDGSSLVAPRLPIPRKTALTAALLAILLAVPYAHPALTRLRTLSPGTSFFPDEDAPQAIVEGPVDQVGEAALPGATDDQSARGDELEAAPRQAQGPIAGGQGSQLPIPASVAEDAPPIPIDDPSNGASLGHFFDRLIEVEQKKPGAIARVLYFGDSIIASDFVTGKLRRMLQTRFGDAGHGYAIVANAYPGWFHIDVARKSSDQWKTSRCIGPFADDALYGLGCVSFTARRENEWFSMGTTDRDKWGTRVSRFELEYLEQPDGGEVALVLDGTEHSRLSTAGPEKKLRHHAIDVPDGPHKLEVRTTTDKPTRLFGMRMERAEPGVTVTALGITGGRARFLDKQDDAHWAEVLRAAKPDLVVLAFGSNEVGDGRMAFDERGQLSKDPMGDYERALESVMRQVRAAVPETSVLLVGPPDMASKREDEGHSKAMVPVFIKHQTNVAKKLGWAFWNQYKAMGGSGSMWSWVQSGLGNSDLIHPTGAGANVLGKMEYLALMKAYEEHKKSRAEAGRGKGP
jgi:lysophospholipase L1-like esterase